MQNEMLKVMSLRILRDIASKIKKRQFTIMVDETTDAGTEEQCVVVIRWVDNGLQSHEDFIGIYAIIKDAIMRMNLSLAQCGG